MAYAGMSILLDVMFKTVSVNNQGILAKYNSATAKGFSFFLDETTLKFTMDEVTVSTEAGVVDANVWYALRVEHRTDNSILIYVDNVEVLSTTGSTITSANIKLVCGKKYSDVDDYYMSGWVKNIKVYKGTLTGSQIIGDSIGSGNRDSVEQLEGILSGVSFGFTGKTADNNDYDITGFITGSLENKEVMLNVPFMRTIVFTENLGNGTVISAKEPEMDVSLKIFKNANYVGVISFSAMNASGLISCPTVTFSAGDYLNIICETVSTAPVIFISDLGLSVNGTSPVISEV